MVERAVDAAHCSVTLFFLRSVSRRIVLVQRRHGLPLVPRVEGLPRIKKGSRPRRAGINGRVSREDRDVTHFSRYIHAGESCVEKRAKSWPSPGEKSWLGIAAIGEKSVTQREFTVHIQRRDKYCSPRGQMKMWGVRGGIKMDRLCVAIGLCRFIDPINLR